MWITFLASAPESGDSISDSPPDFGRLADHLEQSAWWRGKPSPSRVWEKRCKKGGWISVLFGAEISETFPSNPSLELIGYQGDILANPSQSAENDEARTIGDICGPSSNDSSGLFDLEECFSRTWPDTSHSVSVMCLQTWKDLVSDVRSACTQRRKSTRRIDENGSLSSAWPTATVGDSRNSANCTANRKKTGHHSGTTLVDAVRIWPTPAARDWKDTPGMSRDRDGRKGGRLDQLPRLVYATEAEQSGPQDQEKLKQTGSRPVLSPAWVETLMGFPIGWTDCGR